MQDTKLPILNLHWYAEQRRLRLIADIEDNYDIVAVQAYADNLYLKLEDFEDWSDQFEEAFQGRWESFKEYAEQLADECMDAQNTRYFDYDGFTRDLEYDYWTELDRDTYDTLVFSNY
jgi:antirestriction protein